MSDPLLSPRDLALVDAVAERVLELLAERGPSGGGLPLVSASELAEILGVSRDWVYRHQEELGAERIGGDGPRAEHGGRRLRFDREKATRAAGIARQASEESQTPDPPAPTGRSPRTRRRSPGSDVPLLPISGRNGGRSAKNRTP